MQTPTLNEKIGRIVTELGDTKDDVLALTDELCQELWQKIDRRDVDSIRAGSERMIAAVSAVTAFQKSCEDIAARFRGFLPPVSPAPAAPPQPPQPNRQLEAFAGKEKITLRDSWTYHRPFGFVFRGKPQPWRTTWIEVYHDLACALRDSNPQLFETLPDRHDLISAQGNRYMARDTSQLRVAMKLTESVFAESNLSANLIRDNIARLLRVFSVQDSEVEIYLRQ
jgi:hypothetical protein